MNADTSNSPPARTTAVQGTAVPPPGCAVVAFATASGVNFITSASGLVADFWDALGRKADVFCLAETSAKRTQHVAKTRARSETRRTLTDTPYFHSEQLTIRQQSSINMHIPSSNPAALASDRIDRSCSVVPSESLNSGDEAIDNETLETLASRAPAPDAPSSSLFEFLDLEGFDVDGEAAQPAQSTLPETLQPRRPGPLPETLAERSSTGTEFMLAGFVPLRSSIQKDGERISADVVHRALQHVKARYPAEYWQSMQNHCLRQQHLVTRLCEVLAYHDLIDPGVEDGEVMYEVLQAVEAIKFALDC